MFAPSPTTVAALARERSCRRSVPAARAPARRRTPYRRELGGAREVRVDGEHVALAKGRLTGHQFEPVAVG